MDKITGVSIKALKGRKILATFYASSALVPLGERGIKGDWFQAGVNSSLQAGVNAVRSGDADRFTNDATTADLSACEAPDNVG